tara:strand:- start:1226 stop:2215 length:990 start_codon:yes stop_codon:yes gene_type:complete
LNEIDYVHVCRDSTDTYKLTTSPLDRPSWYLANNKGETTTRSYFTDVLTELETKSFKFLSIASLVPEEPPFVMKLEKKGANTFFTMCNDLTVAPVPKVLVFGKQPGEEAGDEAEDAEAEEVEEAEEGERTGGGGGGERTGGGGGGGDGGGSDRGSEGDTEDSESEEDEDEQPNLRFFNFFDTRNFWMTEAGTSATIKLLSFENLTFQMTGKPVGKGLACGMMCKKDTESEANKLFDLGGKREAFSPNILEKNTLLQLLDATFELESSSNPNTGSKDWQTAICFLRATVYVLAVIAACILKTEFGTVSWVRVRVRVRVRVSRVSLSLSLA